MVKWDHRGIGLILWIGSALALGSGCGMLEKLWNEPPNPPRVIVASLSNGGDCSDWMRVFSGSEAESEWTLNCLLSKSDDLWTQIHGAKKDFLTDAELATLVDKGLIQLPGDRAKSWHKIMLIKDLLGFGPGLARSQLDGWIAWAKNNRTAIRGLYQNFMLDAGRGNLHYADLEGAAALAASALRKMGWKKSAAELNSAFLDLFEPRETSFRNGLLPGLRLGLNLLGMICPTQSSLERFSTNEVAGCLEKLPVFFRPSSDWVEFAMNPLTGNFNAERAARIESSVSKTGSLIQNWFGQKRLKPLDTKLLVDFTTALGAAPPPGFVDSLKVIRRFKDGSTEHLIRPSVMNRLYQIGRDFQIAILDGLPSFTEELSKHRCNNPEAKYWTDCTLSDLSAGRRSHAIDYALRLKNPRNGQVAAPFDGELFSKIVLYDALSGQIISLFDDRGNGVISVGLVDGPNGQEDEVVQLITVGMQTYRTIARYMDRLDRWMHGDSSVILDDARSGIDLSKFDMAGFAKLITISSDVLVDRRNRSETDRSPLDALLSNLTNIFPTATTDLDRPAITAVLTSIDLLSRYRVSYLTDILGNHEAAQEASDNGTPIPRDQERKKLKSMLVKNFPDTFASCMQFGFDKSCGPALEKILPELSPGSNLVNPSDLDVLTIMMEAMEGIYETCDRNGDGILSFGFLDGDDELDCGFSRMKAITERMMQAHVLKISAADMGKYSSLLDIVDSVSFTRLAGKVALMTGNARFIPLKPFELPFTKGYATLGSAYGLLADVAAPELVENSNQ